MTPPRLSRGAGDGRPMPPVRMVHLGLGNFFRAHQAWYTERSPDSADWGYAAFTGRSAGLAASLAAQDGLYTVVTRAPTRDTFEVVSSVARAHASDENDAWLDYFRSPDLAALTITVTEAGYFQRTGGGLDLESPAVKGDLHTLRKDRTAPVRTAPARLVAGLAARAEANAGPFAIVPCDNMPANGAVAERVIIEFAAALDADLADSLRSSLTVVTTVVDRITPHTEPVDIQAVEQATGRADASPVVTEPFSEWVLSGPFPRGRPQWEEAGALFSADISGYEHRKLWLLNGAHSLLAYAGSIRGNRTVTEAFADCRSWVEEWWAVAAPHLSQPAKEVAAYEDALRSRFSNPRLRDRLARVAEAGSQKLPVRILPVLRAERAAGRLPLPATRVLAAWICHLRGFGAPIKDARANTIVPLASGPLAEAVPRLLAELDPEVAADADLCSAVIDQAEELAG